MKKVFITLVVVLTIVLFIPMPHWWTIWGEFLYSFLYQYNLIDSIAENWWINNQESVEESRKDNNYWEKCDKNSDCFCHFDDTWYTWCYYKPWQTDMCVDNICQRGSYNN